MRDKDRPAIIARSTRRVAVVQHATRIHPIKTVQKAADIAVQTGSRLSTGSAGSYLSAQGHMCTTSSLTPRRDTHGVTCMRTGQSACSRC